MDDEKLCLGSIGVVILIFVGIAAWTWYDDYKADHKKDKTEILLIQEGDEVSVDYTGYFVGSNGQAGEVFDTTLPEVGRNDSIPKARSFPEKTAYDDLSFTVGDGSMIAGFDQAVLGKKEGQTFTVSIPPEKGYGDPKEELIYNINTTQTLPLRETIARSSFTKIYPSVDLGNQTNFIDPFWGWEIQIMDVDPEEVTILHQPVYQERYKGFPWNTTITDVSTEGNTFTVHHEVQEIESSTVVSMPNLMVLDPYWAAEAQSAASTQVLDKAFVTSKGGLISIDFNKEVVGRTLIFQITINNVVRD